MLMISRDAVIDSAIALITSHRTKVKYMEFILLAGASDMMPLAITRTDVSHSPSRTLCVIGSLVCGRLLHQEDDETTLHDLIVKAKRLESRDTRLTVSWPDKCFRRRLYQVLDMFTPVELLVAESIFMEDYTGRIPGLLVDGSTTLIDGLISEAYAKFPQLAECKLAAKRAKFILQNILSERG